MIYGSVCSGIEAATVAWHGLGWTPKFFSEIERFPKAVLAHHYPNVPDLGDFTKIGTEHGPVDLLVGGTPCQSFSVAGLRKGLDDPRGNLMLEFGALARRLDARWVVWENVPGVLSSGGGRDFGSFLGMLGELGYGFAHRVLDAQFFGVAQRRRRVFVVGHAGGLWQRAAAVLFEPESLRGDPAPRRAPGQRASAGTLERTCGDYSRQDPGSLTLIPFDPLQVTSKANRSTCTPGAPMHTLPAAPAAPAVAFYANLGTQGGGVEVDATPSMKTGGKNPLAVAFRFVGGAQQDEIQTGEFTVGTLAHSNNDHAGHHQPKVMAGSAVRRLTPRECERLQGFPDDYTAIPGASDGPRYRALGNSMAVPVMAWIGRRLDAVDRACRSADEEAA